MSSSSPIRDDLFSPCFSELQRGKLKLLSSCFSAHVPDHGISLEEQTEASVHLNTSIEDISFALDSNSLKLVVDGSFFPHRSVLISATWNCFRNQILLASGDFVFVIELQCKNAYSSELCCYFPMFKFVESLQSHSERNKHMLEIDACCASVIDQLR